LRRARVVKGWGIYDQIEYFKQLGVIDYRGFPDAEAS